MIAPIDEARLRELAEADHAVIRRCVERQPKLYMRGQHEGCYVHSDVADLIDIIGRMSDALSAERERGNRAVGLADYAAHDEDCSVNRYPGHDACSCGLSPILQSIRHDVATQKAEG